jgi:hypothetical protein
MPEAYIRGCYVLTVTVTNKSIGYNHCILSGILDS